MYNLKCEAQQEINFNINANVARGFDQLLQARRGMIVGMINKAMRNNAQTGLM